MNVFIRVSLLHSVATPLNVHVKNWLHGENFKTVRDTQPEQHVGCRSKGPKRRHSVTLSRSQETAARREADQFRVSQSSSTEMVEETAARRKNRQSPNKPFMRQGDSRRSSGQTRRRSASDGCCKGRLET